MSLTLNALRKLQSSGAFGDADDQPPSPIIRPSATPATPVGNENDPASAASTQHAVAAAPIDSDEAQGSFVPLSVLPSDEERFTPAICEVVEVVPPRSIDALLLDNLPQPTPIEAATSRAMVERSYAAHDATLPPVQHRTDEPLATITVSSEIPAAPADKAVAPAEMAAERSRVAMPTPTAYEHQLQQEASKPQFARSIEMLRDELIARCRFHLPDSLLVCSPRSTPRTADVIAHLALVLAKMNEDILLIDANLGEQTLTRHFDAVGEPGLCDVLTGHQDAWHAVRPTSQTRLSLLASGDDVHGISRVPHELNPELMSQLLLAWQRQFHRVLIDVGEVDAALAEPLGRASETILLVVPHPQPNENVMRDTAATLTRWKTNVLGCVLTDVPARWSAS